jgi:hypothetical protein
MTTGKVELTVAASKDLRRRLTIGNWQAERAVHLQVMMVKRLTFRFYKLCSFITAVIDLRGIIRFCGVSVTPSSRVAFSAAINAG